MKKIIVNKLNTKTGIITLLIFLLWFKTMIAYFFDFSLGITDGIQIFTAILNPIPILIIMFSITLYTYHNKTSYTLMFIIYTIYSLLLYSNILYFREFTNFIPFTAITNVFSVTKGLGENAISSTMPHDFIYWIDYLLILILLFGKVIKINQTKYRKINALAISLFGIMLFSFNLMISEANRPQLLGRTFDQTYFIKYLGVPAFTIYDAIQTSHNNQVKSTATGTDIDPALNYIRTNYVSPNKNYFGVARKKNIIVIHLESFQQFLINMKINNQEVTPFLNSLYNDRETLSFKNFFHEVGAGKTSDAETMLETGLFGNPSGTFFQNQAKTNTFQAAPAILQQKQGYTSAVFHGNTGSYYSRDTVYKNLGYNYFFDEKYFNDENENAVTFGMKDKIMFAESAKYLEQLQQPFYTKFITITNHYPYTNLPGYDSDGFKIPDSSDPSVSHYFETAHYLDSALREFFDYLKATGLYDNSMIVLYGDHYGISNDRNKALAPILGYSPDDWNDFNNAQLQRVPFMIHMKGLKGGVESQYGGEIDVLPTILHLTGIDTKNYMQVGSDLLSKQHRQIVAFRNGDFITPNITVLKNGTEVFENKNGKQINFTKNNNLSKKILHYKKIVKQKLSTSDKINRLNLLRFYTPLGFKPIDPKEYNYQNEVQRLIKLRDNLGNSSTSLYSKNNDSSTTFQYNTDAPELQNDRTPIDNIQSANTN